MDSASSLRQQLEDICQFLAQSLEAGGGSASGVVEAWNLYPSALAARLARSTFLQPYTPREATP